MNYREFTTRNRTRVLAGKDAEQNEALVENFMGKKNLIFHTSKPGSPFCVILGKPKKTDKKEIAIFCAKKSHDWRDNKNDVVVHVFTGKNVYKMKGMGTGTFGVKKFKVIRIKKEDIQKFK